MDATAFQLEPLPVIETRNQKTRRQVIQSIEDEHAECRRVANLEADRKAFEARAWFVMSGVDLVDVRDPEDGVSFEDILIELAGRFRDKRPSSSYWFGRELTITHKGKILATLTAGPKGMPTITRHDMPDHFAGAGKMIPVGGTLSPSRWVDPDEAADLVGGAEVLELIAARVGLSVRPFYLRSEIVALGRLPKLTGRPSRRIRPRALGPLQK